MPNVKMGADISSFKSGISQAKSEVRTLDQQMKMLDATMKAEGKSEATLSQQTQTLNSRMAAQKNIAQQAEAALKQMSKNGVDPASESYQKMARELLAAQTGMMETQAALNDLGDSAVSAAGGVDKLESGLSSIGKKISLEQVISGINKITTGLENAAKKAVNLGKSIFDNLMDAAMWADDTATMAMMYGIDLDTYQRMQKLVTNGMDTSVEAILKSQSKLKKGVGDGTDSVMDALRELGLLSQMSGGKTGEVFEFVNKDSIELFWEAGQALMNLRDEAGQLKEYEQESMAQTLFGKSWKELVPLFSQYKNADEFAEALKEVNVNSAEEVQNLATLNDKMGELKGNFDTLSREILAQFAPGLITLSDSLSELLTGIMDYLKTDEGKELLKSMSDSFLGLFDGLKNLSVEDVVGKFQTMFSAVVDGFRWIKENGDTLLSTLEGIGIFWATLKVSEGALTILKVINGLSGLLGAGGAAGAGSGLGAGLGNVLTKAAGGVAGVLGNAALQNAIPGVGDWLMNQTDVGMWFRGTKTPQETLNGIVQDIQKNAATFGDNWNPNSESANIIAQTVGQMWNLLKKNKENTDKFWQQQHQTLTEAQEWNLGEDATIEDSLNFVMQQIHPEVEVDPKIPADTAAQLAEEIGVVSVPVAFVPTTGDPVYSKRTPNRNGIPGHANGLWSVPFDNYLALLHKGERVVPAREVSNRNYSSNLYVEKMYMNNGTDARGLADQLAAAQQRQISGYGG